jgi:hypothetical protein
MQIIKYPATGPWKVHFPTDGSQIGGVDPETYGYSIVPGSKPSLLMSMEGNTAPPGFPAWMAYPASPIQLPAAEPTMNIELSFSLWVDSNTKTAANVIETDTVFVIKGADGKTYSYNGSAQVIIASGLLEVGSDGAGWQSTGIRIPAFTPNVKHKIRISYQINTVTHLISVVSYAVDDVVYAVPVANQNVVATVSTWTLGAYLQLQQGSLPAGNPWTLRFTHFKYRVC